jgi:hypothetical protein
MIKTLTNLFRGKIEESTAYEGLSDFFLRAPVEEKKKVIIEAARKANEDQHKVFKEARLKVKTN